MARNDQGQLHIWSAPSLEAIEKGDVVAASTQQQP